jgi:hypothetical protein
MHQLVILTALTATSGLFGGGSGCHGGGMCGGGRQMFGHHAAPQACYSGPRYVVSGCQQGYGAGYAAPAPAYAPAPAPATPQAAPAPQAAAYYYPSYYYGAPAAAAPSCPNGNCYRR